MYQDTRPTKYYKEGKTEKTKRREKRKARKKTEKDVAWHKDFYRDAMLRIWRSAILCSPSVKAKREQNT